MFSVNEFSGYSADEIYAYHGQDGSITFVDANGIPVSSPPPVVIENGLVCISKKVGIGYSNNSVQEYTPPTTGIYAYTNQDGSIDVVDKDGNLVKSPPHYFQDGSDPNIYLKGKGDQPIIIPEYDPPLDGIFLHKSQDGSYSIVDKNGKPVKSPPHLMIDGANEPHIKGENEEVIKLDVYQPPLTGIFAYTAQDGSVYMVDKDGNQIDSPPHYDVDVISGKVYTKGKDDSAIEIQSYQSPIKDIFIHLNQDGSIDIVDQNGKMIKSPPNITIDVDYSGKPFYMAKYAGLPLESSVQLKLYKPPSSYWDKK